MRPYFTPDLFQKCSKSSPLFHANSLYSWVPIFFGSFVLSTSLYGKNSLGLKVFGGQVILPMVGQMNADVTNCQGGGGGGGGLFQ